MIRAVMYRESQISVCVGHVGEWYATEDDWDLGMPTGQGATEKAAIADLLEQIEERDQ